MTEQGFEPEHLQTPAQRNRGETHISSLPVFPSSSITTGMDSTRFIEKNSCHLSVTWENFYLSSSLSLPCTFRSLELECQPALPWVEGLTLGGAEPSTGGSAMLPDLLHWWLLPWGLKWIFCILECIISS